MVRSIKTSIEGPKHGGEKLWLSVTEMRQGSIASFFLSNTTVEISYAKEWAKNPEVQIYWNLVRKGCCEGDI